MGVTGRDSPGEAGAGEGGPLSGGESLRVEATPGLARHLGWRRNPRTIPYEAGETVEGLLTRLGLSLVDVRAVLHEGRSLPRDRVLEPGWHLVITPALAGG